MCGIAGLFNLNGRPLIDPSIPMHKCRGFTALLVKVDRASMACSLEVRSPFLDQEFVEFAASIPPEYRLRHNAHKFILKEAFADLLPPQIRGRGKQGFEVPFAGWFQKKDWKNLVTDTLSKERLKRRPIFNSDSVLRLRDSMLDNPEAKGMGISAYQLRHRVRMLFIFELWAGMFLAV